MYTTKMPIRHSRVDPILIKNLDDKKIKEFCENKINQTKQKGVHEFFLHEQDLYNQALSFFDEKKAMEEAQDLYDLKNLKYQEKMVQNYFPYVKIKITYDKEHYIHFNLVPSEKGLKHIKMFFVQKVVSQLRDLNCTLDGVNITNNQNDIRVKIQK